MVSGCTETDLERDPPSDWRLVLLSRPLWGSNKHVFLNLFPLSFLLSRRLWRWARYKDRFASD